MYIIVFDKCAFGRKFFCKTLRFVVDKLYYSMNYFGLYDKF